MDRITWTQRNGVGLTGWDGTVNGRTLFTIRHSIIRGEADVLRTTLPFRMPEANTIGEADVLKAYAERVLNTFVVSIGATWSTEENTDEQR